MNTRNFIDYYRVLEVHYDARPEIIQAAYKRLSRLYHPDSATTADAAKMKLLNEAYQILHDTQRRSEYHAKWLEHCSARNRFVTSGLLTPPGQGDSSIESARAVMELFFQAQKFRKHDEAYLLLTKEDHEHTGADDFATWRNLVEKCYEMQDFKVRYFSSYRKCRIGDTIYPYVAEFAVTVTDMDTLTMEVSSETLHKYTAFDGVSWKVCLGVRSVQKSILQLQLLAEKRENFDPMMLYRSAVSFHDPLTGLLSERGFMEEAGREAQRSKRYHNPFSLAVFKLHQRKDTGDSQEQSSNYRGLCLFSSILTHSLRGTDISGKLNNDMIICLFIETRIDGAKRAVHKFHRLFEEKLKRQRQENQYFLSHGIVEYQEYKNIEECVYEACSAASVVDDEITF